MSWVHQFKDSGSIERFLEWYKANHPPLPDPAYLVVQETEGTAKVFCLPRKELIRILDDKLSSEGRDALTHPPVGMNVIYFVGLDEATTLGYLNIYGLQMATAGSA